MNRRIGAIMSYLLMGLEVVITLFLTPYIIRTLGDAEYGVYKLSESITSYLLLLDFGVGNAVIRYIAKFRANNEQQKIEKFIGLSTLFYGAVGILTFIAGETLIFFVPTFFSKGLSAEELTLAKTLLQITTVNAAVTLGTSGYSNAIIAYEKFLFSKSLSIIQIIFRSICIYIALVNGMGSIGIALSQLFITIICRCVNVLYVLYRMKITPKFKNFEFSFVREVAGYSGIIFLLMIATQINTYADQIILGSCVEASAAIIAVYGVGLQIEYYFENVGSAMNSVLMPGVVKLIETDASPQKLCDEMVRIGRMGLAVLAFVWMAFLICGRMFIHLWIGEGYRDAYLVTILLMSVQTFIIVQSVGEYMLSAMNQLKEVAILRIGVILLNVGVSLILVQWNPLIGTLIGTVLSLLLGGVIAKNYVYAKRIHINLWDYYKRLLHHFVPCGIITVIVGSIVDSFTGNDWIGMIVTLSVMFVIYAVLLWIYAFNKQEKTLIVSLINLRSFRSENRRK